MDIRIVRNPVVEQVKADWNALDDELSQLSKESRVRRCREYQWMFPKAKREVNLESLYSVRWRHNREEFDKWLYVVCGFTLCRIHLGDSSYYQYKKEFQKVFQREKCTSDVFPSQVLLVLAMLGYITELSSWYVYNEGSGNNRGYRYKVDKDKLYFGATYSAITTVSFREGGVDADSLSWSKYSEWLSERQCESIKSVEVLSEGITASSKWLFSFEEFRSYYDMSPEEQNDSMKEWISYQRLRNLSCGIVGECLDDSDKPDGMGAAGRFYSIMTNMRSDHRHRFLRLDGERVVEVDISSAQPTFLGVMLFKESGRMSEWLRQCLGGTFYEWIKEKTQSDEDRSTIKVWMMRYMYSCYQPNKPKDFEGPHRPTYENKKTGDPYLGFQKRLNRFLKKNEKDIFKKIDSYKRHPEYRKDKPLYETKEVDGEIRKKLKGKGKWCSKLSLDLVKMEVEYIKRCIQSLPDEEKFWTIHDCICVKESRSEEVMHLMEKVSREMFGDEITLKLKRENTSDEIED